MVHPRFLIEQATQFHVEVLSFRFAQYLAFYGISYPEEQVSTFLKERIANRDSVIYIATTDQEIGGFIQLYPSFTLLQLGRFWVLNDLFVAENFQGQGLAIVLLEKAKQLLVDTGAKAMMLDTQLVNTKARKLYESFGFVQNQESAYYYLWV